MARRSTSDEEHEDAEAGTWKERLGSLGHRLLKFVMDEIIASFRASHSADEIAVTYGSSGNLYTRIHLSRFSHSPAAGAIPAFSLPRLIVKPQPAQSKMGSRSVRTKCDPNRQPSRALICINAKQSSHEED